MDIRDSTHYKTGWHAMLLYWISPTEQCNEEGLISTVAHRSNLRLLHRSPLFQQTWSDGGLLTDQDRPQKPLLKDFFCPLELTWALDQAVRSYKRSSDPHTLNPTKIVPKQVLSAHGWHKRSWGDSRKTPTQTASVLTRFQLIEF